MEAANAGRFGGRVGMLEENARVALLKPRQPSPRRAPRRHMPWKTKCFVIQLIPLLSDLVAPALALRYFTESYVGRSPRLASGGLVRQLIGLGLGGLNA